MESIMQNINNKNNQPKFLKVRSRNKGLDSIIYDIMIEKAIDKIINKNLSEGNSAQEI